MKETGMMNFLVKKENNIKMVKEIIIALNENNWSYTRRAFCTGLL